MRIWTCPKCGTLNKWPYLVVCDECGEPIPAEQFADPSDYEDVMSGPDAPGPYGQEHVS